VSKLKHALQLSQSMATISNEQSFEAGQNNIEKQLEYRALAPAALSRMQTKNGELNKITKKDILSIMFSVFLVLDYDKMKKDLLMDAFVKCYEKSPANIPFCHNIPSNTDSNIIITTAPAERGWDEENAPFDVGASWDPNNPSGAIDTCLKSLLSSLRSPWWHMRPACTLKAVQGKY
jgi:hypothetical protein